MNIRTILRQLYLTSTITLVAALSISAAVPTTISYQGLLSDDTGQPIADNDYSVTFTIYNSAGAGDSIWAEIQTVSTADGLFTVLLGANNPLVDTVFNGTTRFLGIKIEAGPELLPRTAMVSVPFAFRASQSDSSDAVTDGGIDLTDIGQNGAGNGQIMKWNGSAWTIAADATSGSGWNWSDSSSYGPDTVGTAAGLKLPLVLSGNSSNYIFDITNNGTGNGLVSYSLGSGAQNRGLYGHAENGSSSNYGVYGRAEGDFGIKIGTYGQALGSGINTGSYGLAENGDFNYAFSGIARGPATNYGGEFEADSGTYNVGVSGQAFGSGSNFGVEGKARGGDYNYGLYSTINDLEPAAYNYGLYSRVEGEGSNYGVYSEASGGYASWAGYFEGNVHVNGDASLNGNLSISRYSPDHLIFELDTENHRMKFYDFSSNYDRRLMEFSAFTGGQIRLYYEADTANDLTYLNAGPNGGELTLRDQNGDTKIFFRGNHSDISNNDRVILHEGSVDDVELMNEPGVAQAKSASCFTITSTTSMQDVITVTIDIPAPGYIFLNGHGLVELSGTVNSNRMKAQIDETAGGSALNGYYTRIGLGGYVSASASAFCDFDMNCQRMYYKDSAGSYTFRLEALKESSYTAKICFSTLTATYFPTSYGTVAAIAAGQGDVPAQSDVDTPTSEANLSSETIDLRQQERVARQSRSEELEAQLDMLE
jgi:hypothetical protein